MRTRSKLLLGALTAALVLAAAVSTASARRLEVSNTGIRAVFNELTFSGGPFTISCPVTLEGTLHSRTISKVSGQLIGYITRAIVKEAACTGGTASILQASLPWHVQYNSFRSERGLPRIEGVRVALIGAAFRLRVRILGSEVLCLYKSTQASPALGILELNTESGRVEGLRAEEGGAIPFLEGAGVCPASGNFRGRATVTLLGNTTAITIRLVQ